MSAGHTLAVVPDRLYALASPYELDGRVSSHPLTVRGYSTNICYLLKGQTRSLLYGTGYSVHEQQLLGQLSELLHDERLDIAIPRIEFSSMCNARAVVERFDVDVAYLRMPESPANYLNLRPKYDVDDPGALRDVRHGQIMTTEPIVLEPDGARALRFIVPHLRLLPSNWGFDEGTGTLFSGDMFAWVWHDTPAGPWLIDGAEQDPTDRNRVQDFLINNRYWWLAGAETETFRAAVAEMFDRYPVRAIAPDHGAVLTGKAIARHRALLDEVLEGAPDLSTTGVSLGQRSLIG